MATTGDASGRLAAKHNCGPILRQTRSTKGKADQAFSRQIFGCARKKGLAYEFGFLELDGPADIGFIRVGEGVGVDTDNHVALFESEQPLGLDAEWPDVRFAACLQQSLPQRFRGFSRAVYFPASFAYETDAEKDNGGPRDVRFAAGHVRKGARGQITVGELPQHLAAFWSRHVHCPIARSHVGDMHVPAASR